MNQLYSSIGFSFLSKRTLTFFFLFLLLGFSPLFAQLSVSLDVQTISCTGATDGSITANPSGGDTPYTYVWSNNATTQSISNLAAGDYGVTVTDANGTTVTGSTTLSDPDPLLAIVTVLSNVSCNQGFNGAASVVASGGAGFYIYSWSDGQVGANATNLVAGTYSVTSTDANGCTTTNNVTITEPPAVTLTANITGVTCNGDNDGSITAVADNGVAPYSYSWSNGAVTAGINGLPQGSYTVTATDANGCTAEATYEIGNPVTIEVVLTITNPLLCNGDQDAIISVVADGGQDPLTYEWSNGQMGRIISNLGVGDYTVTVTDANGCSVTATQSVDQPDVITLTIDKTDAECGVAPNGTISITAMGGTPDYTFAWSTGATTSSIEGLGAGSYDVTVTDANGCAINQSIEIGGGGSTPLEGIAVPLRGVTCPGGFDGAASIIVNGGVPPYLYTWSDGQTGKNSTNLIGGDYFVTATDANGCTLVREVTISEPEEFSISVTKADISCNGGSNGSARLSVFGGTAPYSFEWSNGATTDAIMNLTAGTYMATVTDNNDCTTSRTIEITEPAPVTVMVMVVDDPNDPNNPNDPCKGATGLAMATGGGGTPPYSFAWSTGESTETVSGLTPGSYTVTLTDAFGCMAEQTIEIQSFPALMLMISGTDANCGDANDGTASVSVMGGALPYTYEWSNGGTTADISGLSGGTYDVVVTDNNGCSATESVTIGGGAAIEAIAVPLSDVTCNGGFDGAASIIANGGTPPYSYTWSSGMLGQNATNLSAGTFTATATDANGCSIVKTVTINEPPAITLTFAVQNVGCGDDPDATASVKVNPTGGAGAFAEYLWSNGATTETITDLVSGTYSVTVTDVSGCTAVGSVEVESLPGPSVSIDKTDIVCNGEVNGTATAVVTGGRAPIAYEWSNGATTQSITGLAAGTYSVTATDAKGCSASAQTTIIEPSVFKIDFAKADPICNGEATGSALAQGWGGTMPYTFLWDNGSTEAERKNLLPGTYSVTVTDNNGCAATGSVTIEEKAPITISFDVEDVGCVPNATTSATANASGGNGEYALYNWSDGQQTQTATGLISGSYTVTVTDVNGCTGVGTVQVNISQPPSVSIDKQDILCFEDNNGKAAAVVSGGVAPFTYQWSNGSTSGSIENLGPADYGVTVTDAKGCSASAQTTIIEPFLFKIDFAKADAICNGDATGSALAQGWGGTPPFTYLWSTGETTAEIKGLAKGTYSVTVTDNNGCVATGEVTIDEPDPVTVSFEVGETECTHNTSTSATAIAAGGNGTYAVYQWSNGQNTATATGLTDGTYTVTVTDINGCTGVGTVDIDISAPPSISLSKEDVKCAGESNGSATANVSGGDQPYTYTWSNGGTGSTISGLAAGTYSVTVTTAAGCSSTASIEVKQPLALVANVLVSDNVCHGESAGTATANVSGGTPLYTYAWSTGATSNQINGLTAGDYSLTVTDNNGCQQVINFSISEPTLLTSVAAGSDATCNGGADGTAAVTAMGGTLPYTYAWSNGDNTASVAGLTAGDYNVIVTDANGCTTTSSVSISAPTALTVSFETGGASCSGEADGFATANVSGGTAPYTYKWSDGQTTKTATGLLAGTYTIAITDTNGCIHEASVTVEEAKTSPDIKGRVWFDGNQDGLQGQFEGGIGGAMIDLLTPGPDGKLCTADDVIYDTQTTGDDGHYKFACLPSGKYLVHFSMIPYGFQFTHQNVGNGTNDSDADSSNGKAQELNLGDTDICNIDAGVYPICEPLQHAGTIGESQSICKGSTPNTLTGTVPSDFGEIEYLWMYNHTGGGFNPTSWSAIHGSNSRDYSPGELYKTTYFLRCVRRKGCETYIESNMIKITVSDCRSAFIDFSANETKGNVQLTWTSTPEHQEVFYQVESSKDGERFETLELIKGAGDANQLVTYEYQVQNANAGMNHYRIRRLEFGNDAALSDIAQVRIESRQTLMVYPNPFYSEAMIESADSFEAGSTIRVVNNKGTIIRNYELPKGGMQFKLSLNDEPSGIYFIQIVRKDGSVDAHKIQKME